MGLPGNPVSSFVTFLVLVRPFLLALQCASHLLPKIQTLPAHFELPKADARREFLRVKKNDQGGLDLFKNQSSGVLTSCVWADGLLDNPSQQVELIRLLDLLLVVRQLLVAVTFVLVLMPELQQQDLATKLQLDLPLNSLELTPQPTPTSQLPTLESLFLLLVPLASGA